jgi:DNA-binding transcriptional LysR family regulator
MGTRRTPRLSLDLLRGFRLAARYLSFTRAARELFVTQSAISREIRTLESQMGRPLFRRVHRTLELTPVGEQLYRAVDEALGGLDAVIDRLSGEGVLLTVATTPALASLWLAPRLSRFSRVCPGVEVRVVTSNDRPDMDRDQLDIGIRFVAAGEDTPKTDLLMPCTSFPVCAPALAAEPARPLRTPADLERHVRLDYESVRDGRRWSEWEFWFRASGNAPVKPQSTLRFPQFDQCFPAAIDGAGVAIGVLPHILEQLTTGSLTAPFGAQSAVERGGFYLVYRRDAAERAEVRNFVAWLHSEVERDTRAAPFTPPGRARPRGPRAATPPPPGTSAPVSAPRPRAPARGAARTRRPSA